MTGIGSRSPSVLESWAVGTTPMRAVGFEPTPGCSLEGQARKPDSKSGAATNFATPATIGWRTTSPPYRPDPAESGLRIQAQPVSYLSTCDADNDAQKTHETSSRSQTRQSCAQHFMEHRCAARSCQETSQTGLAEAQQVASQVTQSHKTNGPRGNPSQGPVSLGLPDSNLGIGPNASSTYFRRSIRFSQSNCPLIGTA